MAVINDHANTLVWNTTDWVPTPDPRKEQVKYSNPYTPICLMSADRKQNKAECVLDEGRLLLAAHESVANPSQPVATFPHYVRSRSISRHCADIANRSLLTQLRHWLLDFGATQQNIVQGVRKPALCWFSTRAIQCGRKSRVIRIEFLKRLDDI